MERKEFLKSTLGLCGLSVLPAAFLQSCTKSAAATPTPTTFTIDISTSSYSALQTVGNSVVANGVLIIRKTSAAFEAFSSYCTHEGCTVHFDSSSPYIYCPCHGGMFNPTTGAVVSGPPPTALTKYTATLSGNNLTITP
jgi:cytochrome b6-f complex iron-sulfur subunit